MADYVNIENLMEWANAEDEDRSVLQRVQKAANRYIERRLNISYDNFLLSSSYSELPEDLTIAIDMVATHWFTYRQEYTDGAPIRHVPDMASSIIRSYKWPKVI